MKYFLIAGETSGDLHGAALMKALREHDTDADFRYFGGDHMQQQGGKLLRHCRDMAFMGGIEVLMNIKKIKYNLTLCKSELLRNRPDVLILIDYPSFNMKIAQFARKNKIRVFWFIAPKVWAWKEWRIKNLKAYIDEIFAILPFEKEYFARHSLNVHYYGNPLVDQIENAKTAFRDRESFLAHNKLDNRPLIALLPGSRVQEIRYMLPVMTRLAHEFPGFRFAISGAPSMPESIYKSSSVSPDIPVLYGQTYELLHHAQAALVTSGTATLEAALLNVPQVILYKMMGGKISYKIFRYLFLKVKYISLPNIILGRESVKELVMNDMNVRNTRNELHKLLNNETIRNNIMNDYAELQRLNGEKGAAGRIAEKMVALLKKS